MYYADTTRCPCGAWRSPHCVPGRAFYCLCVRVCEQVSANGTTAGKDKTNIDVSANFGLARLSSTWPHHMPACLVMFHSLARVKLPPPFSFEYPGHPGYLQVPPLLQTGPESSTPQGKVVPHPTKTHRENNGLVPTRFWSDSESVCRPCSAPRCCPRSSTVSCRKSGSGAR